MERYLTPEIKDYILRLHWAGFQFSAIAFKVSKTYNLSVSRETVDYVINESLSRKITASS